MPPRATSHEEPTGRPVTVRAVVIGLVLVVGINLVMLYNDYYLRNTPLILNHLPTAGTAILLLFALLSHRHLDRAERLLIWSMVALGGGVGSTGFWRGVPGFMAAPAWFATESNDYLPRLVRQLPDWMVVSKDPSSPAVRWYFEGLPIGQRIPWGAWAAPVCAWGAFGLAEFAFMFAAVSLFYRRWAEDERLTFPIVQLPEALAAAPEAGWRLPPIFSSRLAWAGMLVPILVYGLNGARSYRPALPQIPLSWWAGNFFDLRPWQVLSFGSANLYFAIVGLTFLLTTEVSFSLWFFYVLFQLSFVGVDWLGAAGRGYVGGWRDRVIVHQAGGAVIAMAVFLTWAARRALRQSSSWLLGRTLTLALLVGGAGGVWGWIVAAGGQWWAALIGTILFLSVILVLTRLVVEGGLLLSGVEAIPFEFVSGLVPPSWLSGRTLAALVELRGGIMSDLRELVMPYLMHAVRACTRAGIAARSVLAVMALTLAVAWATAGYARIATAYKYGAARGDASYNGGWQVGLYATCVKFSSSPPDYDWMGPGETRLVPVAVAHALTGAAVTAGLLALRAFVPWWPLAPWGYLVCGSWAMSMIWFSLLVGWLAKALVMTFGGAVAYRRLLPFFLGLVLGQAVIAAVWTCVSFLTGVPGIYMLPD